MTRMIRIFAGYCIRLTPARSAAAYAHQVHKKQTIWGSKLVSFIRFFPYIYLNGFFSFIQFQAGQYPAFSFFHHSSCSPDLCQKLIWFKPPKLGTVGRTGSGTVPASLAEDFIDFADAFF